MNCSPSCVHLEFQDEDVKKNQINFYNLADSFELESNWSPQSI